MPVVDATYVQAKTFGPDPSMFGCPSMSHHRAVPRRPQPGYCIMAYYYVRSYFHVRSIPVLSIRTYVCLAGVIEEHAPVGPQFHDIRPACLACVFISRPCRKKGVFLFFLFFLLSPQLKTPTMQGDQIARAGNGRRACFCLPRTDK
jgi:hypothetical protein